MINIIAKVDESGTAVQVEEISGSINNILDETASIVASVVGNILTVTKPEGVTEREFEAFIIQEIINRMKKSIKQLMEGEAEVTDRSGNTHKGLVIHKKKTISDIINERRDGIDMQPDDEKKYFN